MKRLTKEQKRAENRRRIALDVIAQLDAYRYIAEQRVYVKFDPLVSTGVLQSRGDMRSKLSRLVSSKKPCKVCGLGACFISAVRLFDKVALQDVISYGIANNGFRDERHDVEHLSMREKLLPYFTHEELGVIEAAFENKVSFIGGEWRGGESVTAAEEAAREEFRNAYLLREVISVGNAGTRLRFLMTAVANLAHTVITVRGLKDQALVALGSNSRYQYVRDGHGL